MKVLLSQEQRTLLNKLKAARNEAGLTQVQAAKRLRRTQSYLAKIETGRRRLCVTQLQEFARLYNKSVDYFLAEGGENDAEI